MTTKTTDVAGLPAPAWAVEHTEEDAGIRWTRGVEVQAEPIFLSDPPEVVKIEAYLYDRVEVVRRHRDPDPRGRARHDRPATRR